MGTFWNHTFVRHLPNKIMGHLRTPTRLKYETHLIRILLAMITSMGSWVTVASSSRAYEIRAPDLCGCLKELGGFVEINVRMTLQWVSAISLRQTTTEPHHLCVCGLAKHMLNLFC